jgi:hypothetical protein
MNARETCKWPACVLLTAAASAIYFLLELIVMIIIGSIIVSIKHYAAADILQLAEVLLLVACFVQKDVRYAGCVMQSCAHEKYE